MFRWRSLNLEIIPLDPVIERTARKNLRTPVELETIEMGDQCDNIPEKVEQGKNENVEKTRSLRELFAPIATNSPSCIVLPTTNATHFDLKPHVNQLLLAFHDLELENPYSPVKKFKKLS